MTSVRSHRLPLSGNKWLFFTGLSLVIAACSPKIQPTSPEVRKPVVVAPEVKVAPKTITVAHTPTVAMILPFELDKITMGANASLDNLSQSDLAVDYYQGFKMALDSLTAKGYNFNLRVYDSKGDNSQAHSLANNPQIRNSDIIVGPVYPESIKAFTASLVGINKPVISPLSPAPPAEFKDNNLVTITPPLEYHAWRVAQYIKDRIKPVKIFVLKSGYSEENKYIIPFKKAVDSLSRKKIQVVYFTVSKGNFDAILPQLSTQNENVFVIPATDQTFLAVTLTGLEKLSQSYPVTVFGHPNWAKFSYLQPKQLQKLKTSITFSDKIDYHAANINGFIKAYRKAYKMEPGEYAIKGFDQGYYLGTLLSTDADAFKKLDKLNYDGLHNQFTFTKTATNGWVNTHVSLYQYQNFELKPVQ